MDFINEPDDEFIVIRPQTIQSFLPRESILNKNASLVIRDDISFTAIRAKQTSEYYELKWSHPKEISFFSSIILAIVPTSKVFFFPVRWPFYLPDCNQDLSNNDLIDQIVDTLIVEINSKNQSSDIYKWEFLPPAIINKSYNFTDCNFSKEYVNFLFDIVDTNNDILIRGLSHLIKYGMLSQLGRLFSDTASIELYISMEATHHMIIEKLKSNGIRNPSNKDASDFLLRNFKEEYRLDRYYEEFYDDRIKAVHPKSRFGTAMYVPGYISDLYQLYNDLIRNYEFLITNKPNCYKNYI